MGERERKARNVMCGRRRGRRGEGRTEGETGEQLNGGLSLRQENISIQVLFHFILMAFCVWNIKENNKN